jgi:hypothetical protein
MSDAIRSPFLLKPMQTTPQKTGFQKLQQLSDNYQRNYGLPA